MICASRDLWTRDARLKLVPWLDALDEHAAGWPTGRLSATGGIKRRGICLPSLWILIGRSSSAVGRRWLRWSRLCVWAGTEAVSA